MKKIFAMIALAAATLPAMAQLEGTKVDDRIGHGEDSLLCRQNLSYFAQNLKDKNYQDAYTNWKLLMEKAPLAQMGLYTNGWTMLTNLIGQAPDKATKKKYLDDMMWMHDTRLKNVQALNSFSTPKSQTSKGAILCRKAYDYTAHAPAAYDDYKLDTAYDMFTEGINMVNEDPSHEVEAWVLQTYFNVSYQKYAKNPTEFHEQFLKDYLLCKEVCEKMLQHANLETDSVAAQAIVAQYDPALYSVETQFIESKAADRDQLIKIFTPKVEEKKNDLAYLRSVLNILSNNDCDDADVYYTAAKYAYDIEPSYDAAIGMAQRLSSQGDNAGSVQYYDKAIELCKDDKTKGKIAMKVVYALAKSGRAGNTDSYLSLAERYDPSLSGKVNFFRAQNAATSRNYGDAIAYARKAAQQDPSISGNANRLIARIEDAQKQYQARKAEYDKANAEYKQQLEKQQKLENFWKGR